MGKDGRTLRRTEQAQHGAYVRCWTADTPFCEISVHDSAVCGEECGEVGTHAENLPGTGDELLDGSDAVVWDVVAECWSEPHWSIRRGTNSLICHGVQAGAGTALVTTAWGYEGMGAGVANVLRGRVEWRDCQLPLAHLFLE